MNPSSLVKENRLEVYYKKRLQKVYKSDLNESLFANDNFNWNTFTNKYIGQEMKINMNF